MGDTVIASGISRSVTAFSIKDGTPIGSMSGAGEELAAPPHVITGEGLPIVVFVSHDLNLGTLVNAVSRDFEPKVLPMAPLPNPFPPPVAPEALPADQDQPADTDRVTGDAVMP
jgi:hypothetical protein